MNKISKIISVIMLIMMVMSISVVVSAATNDDVISYVTMAHTVNGRTVQLNRTQRQSLTQYLKENPVTNREADEIIAKLSQAKVKLEQSGATNLSQLSNSVKTEVISLVKSAGAIAGLDVQVDTVNETVTIKTLDKKRTIISATSYKQFKTNASAPTVNPGTSNDSSTASTNKTQNKLVYTGNDFGVAIKTIIAIVAIAITAFILKSKYAK